MLDTPSIEAFSSKIDEHVMHSLNLARDSITNIWLNYGINGRFCPDPMIIELFEALSVSMKSCLEAAFAEAKQAIENDRDNRSEYRAIYRRKLHAFLNTAKTLINVNDFHPIVVIERLQIDDRCGHLDEELESRLRRFEADLSRPKT